MKKIKQLLLKVSAMGTAILAFPSKSFAAVAWFRNPIEADTLDELISTILNAAIGVAGVVAVGFLIFNGIKYMVSGGDATKTEEAQKGLANAVIGLVICLAAYLLVNFVMGLLGAQLTSIE